MSWFTTLISGGVDKIVDSTMKGLDNLFTSDEEKAKAEIILKRNMQDFKLSMEDKANDYEKTVTDRWKSDNEHSITRLVRPVSYGFILVLFGIMVLGDGNWGISIKEAYIPVIESLLVTMTIALFGSRGIEKTMKHMSKKKI